jgi:hypothetical protein
VWLFGWHSTHENLKEKAGELLRLVVNSGTFVRRDERRTRPVQHWNPGIAAVLSFLIPGLGQMYKGQEINGLRHSYIKMVGKTGVSPKEHQDLARHSTYALTGRYTYSRMYDLAAAATSLRSFKPNA